MKRVVVFDFDGVIVPDSEKFKSDAWHALYSESHARTLFEETEQKFGRGRGGDRHDIIRHVLAGLGVAGIELGLRTASDAARFDELVQEQICRAGVSSETREALATCSASVPTYLNTATPREVIERTLIALAVRQYFKGVLGRPRSKIENFKHVAEQEKVSPSQIIFLGDSPTDHRAAVAFGCVFFGLGNQDNGWGTMPQSFPVVRDVEEFTSKVLR